MNKLINLLAVLVLASQVHAGNGNLVKGVQGKQVIPARDATSELSAQERYERAIKWIVPVTFGALSGTSGGGVTMTGASTNYVGPYYVMVNVTSTGTVHFLSTTYVAANADAVSPTGRILTQTYGSGAVLGPFNEDSFFHLRGGNNASCGGNYQIGFCE